MTHLNILYRSLTLGFSISWIARAARAARSNSWSTHPASGIWPMVSRASIAPTNCYHEYSQINSNFPWNLIVKSSCFPQSRWVPSAYWAYGKSSCCFKHTWPLRTLLNHQKINFHFPFFPNTLGSIIPNHQPGFMALFYT